MTAAMNEMQRKAPASRGWELRRSPRRTEELSPARRDPERVQELIGLEVQANAGPRVRQLRALETSVNDSVAQLLSDEERVRLWQAIVDFLGRYGVPFDDTRVQQILNVVDPPPAEVRISSFREPEELAIVDRGTTSLQDALLKAELLILRMAALSLPIAMTEEPAPTSSIASSPAAPVLAEDEPTTSTAPAPTRRRPEQQLFRPSRERAEAARERAAARPRVETDQERMRRERVEGGAAIAPRLATATINPAGGRWGAHLVDGGDGTAEISWHQAKAILRRGENVMLAGPGRGGGRNYSIEYERGLSIVFSTPDDGATVSVFHIGPGG